MHIVSFSEEYISIEEIKTIEIDEILVIESKNNIFKSIISRLPLTSPFSSKISLFAIMVENHEDARRYHLGLEEALLIQEFYVEGFISRFVALFSMDDIPEAIGPVRSIRPYFLDAFFPWSSIIFHAGGSP
ncbi:MAG: DUF3048 domain-containing protein, partial [Candidatus Peribacteraceae bacterium]|nr:DUF3048 domain-containing protein [Candidatus Peribacteraceae bacterium]